MTPEQIATLKEAILGTTTGSRQVVVADTSVSLYATDENCLIYRVKLDPAKRTRDRQIADAWFHAKFDPTTCLELLEEVERLTALIDKSQTCVVCEATLCEPETPPHCGDCILTEEHYEK